MSDITLEERWQVSWLLDWMGRMARRYGRTVYDRDGKIWDWGQALCRECYGTDWIDIIKERNIESPTWEDIDRAKRWEEGDLPAWFLNEEK